ncbi:hypothetical protein ZWY2020_041391 [Hordeum vulgare]|nr:hypothetical protein ZWY2020_041391 [Hordeum vulgare]
MASEPEQAAAALGGSEGLSSMDAHSIRLRISRRRPRTPLEHTVDGGNLPALRYLLDHGADLTQERG